jgi:hypothetical protein
MGSVRIEYGETSQKDLLNQIRVSWGINAHRTYGWLRFNGITIH